MSVIKNTTAYPVSQASTIEADANTRLFEYAVAEYVKSKQTQNGQQSDTLSADTCLKADCELARIAVGLKQSPLMRIWIILQQLNRDTGLQGHTRAAFDAALRSYGVKGCDAYTSRLLRRGAGLYWNLDNGIIYPCGYVSLCMRLAEHAHKRGLHDLYASGNHPGQRKDMYIRVSGTCAQFEGAVLASWYHAHNHPTISRYTLSALFNRDRRSLWHMERAGGVTVVYNEAETSDPSQVPLRPDGSAPRGDVYQTTDKKTGVIVYHFRLSNTYQASMIRQHNRRGQSRRAAVAFKQWFDSIELHSNSEGKGSENFRPLVKLNPAGRIYCADDKAVKRTRKRGNVEQLYIRWKPGRGSGVVWRVSSVSSH